jgi:membrane protein
VTGGGSAPPSSGDKPQDEVPVLAWRARLEALQRSVMRKPLVLGVMDGMRVFDRGGGGMLAGALAYFAFFTLVPALLLFVSLLGILVENESVREDLINGLVSQIEPIADIAEFIVNQIASAGRAGTIVGVIGLLWGASGFYGALQGAMQRMFPGPGGRDFLHTRLRGVITVVFILGAMLTAVVIIFALPLATEWLQARCVELNGLNEPLIDEVCSLDFSRLAWALAVVGAMAVAFLAALVVYVAIPPDGPTFRQAFWPAVVVGIVIGLFTSLFGLISPLLVRHWLAFGIVGSVFIALIWFNLVFQALIYGAAWARIRRDRDRTRNGPPSF